MPENKELDKQGKKIAGLFFDLNKMEKALDEIMKNLPPSEGSREGCDYKLDFSMTISPSGEIIVEGKNKQKQVSADFRAPLVEISEHPENILVTAEMPGVEEKDLQVKSLENRAVEIIASGEKKFYKRIDFPQPIGKKISQKFKNGILELKLEKAKI